MACCFTLRCMANIFVLSLSVVRRTRFIYRWRCRFEPMRSHIEFASYHTRERELDLKSVEKSRTCKFISFYFHHFLSLSYTSYCLCVAYNHHILCVEKQRFVPPNKTICKSLKKKKLLLINTIIFNLSFFLSKRKLKFYFNFFGLNWVWSELKFYAWTITFLLWLSNKTAIELELNAEEKKNGEIIFQIAN